MKLLWFLPLILSTCNCNGKLAVARRFLEPRLKKTVQKKAESAVRLGRAKSLLPHAVRRGTTSSSSSTNTMTEMLATLVLFCGNNSHKAVQQLVSFCADMFPAIQTSLAAQWNHIDDTATMLPRWLMLALYGSLVPLTVVSDLHGGNKNVATDDENENALLCSMLAQCQLAARVTLLTVLVKAASQVAWDVLAAVGAQSTSNNSRLLLLDAVALVPRTIPRLVGALFGANRLWAAGSAVILAAAGGGAADFALHLTIFRSVVHVGCAVALLAALGPHSFLANNHEIAVRVVAAALVWALAKHELSSSSSGNDDKKWIKFETIESRLMFQGGSSNAAATATLCVEQARWPGLPSFVISDLTEVLEDFIKGQPDIVSLDESDVDDETIVEMDTPTTINNDPATADASDTKAALPAFQFVDEKAVNVSVHIQPPRMFHVIQGANAVRPIFA